MISLKSIRRAALPGLMALTLLNSVAQAQQSFPTPEDAAAALAAAVKSGPSDILKVLGKAADDIVSSGDEVADADTRQRFTSMYDTKHSFKTEGNKKAMLMLGQATSRSRFHLSTPGPDGSSTPIKAESRFSIAVSAATSSTRSRPVSPLSMLRTNMPTRIAAKV